jgi:hypothetical protein
MACPVILRSEAAPSKAVFRLVDVDARLPASKPNGLV